MRVSYYIAILLYCYIVNTEASLCSRQTIPVYPLLCFRSRSCSECSNPLHLVDSKPQRFIPTDGLPLRALSPSGLGAQLYARSPRTQPGVTAHKANCRRNVRTTVRTPAGNAPNPGRKRKVFRVLSSAPPLPMPMRQVTRLYGATLLAL